MICVTTDLHPERNETPLSRGALIAAIQLMIADAERASEQFELRRDYYLGRKLALESVIQIIERGAA